MELEQAKYDPGVAEALAAPYLQQKGVEQLVMEHIAAAFDALPMEDFRQVQDLHAMVVKKADAAVVKYVMKRTGGNQVHSAAILGINRNTLRKRLREFGLL